MPFPSCLRGRSSSLLASINGQGCRQPLDSVFLGAIFDPSQFVRAALPTYPRDAASPTNAALLRRRLPVGVHSLEFVRSGSVAAVVAADPRRGAGPGDRVAAAPLRGSDAD